MNYVDCLSGTLYAPTIGMNDKTTSRHDCKKDARFYFGLSVFTLAALEIVLCFIGPLAFLQKPNLLLFPLSSSTLTRAQTQEAGDFVERQLVLTRSYAVVSHRFIVEYYVRTNPDFDRSKISSVDLSTARDLARELGLRRFALGWIYESSERCELSLAIWDPSVDTALLRADFVAGSFDDLLEGTGIDGKPLDFHGKLHAPMKGIGPADTLVLAVFILQAGFGILLLSGRPAGLLVEMLWGSISILFLFNYIYATNANMDYMQRYIAMTGQLRLAINTTTERLQACVRYVPSLFLLGLYWVMNARTLRLPFDGRRLGPTWWRVRVERWSIPLTITSAVLFGMSFPSPVALDGIGVLAWIALVPVFFVLATSEPRRALFCGVYFGVLQGLFINYWHGTYDYISLHMVIIVTTAEYLMFMVALVWLLRIFRKWGFIFAPLAWVFFDWCRSIGIIGYPWGIAGTTQYRFLPLIQISSVTGVWGVDFLVLFVNAAIAWAVAAPILGWSWAHGGADLNRRPRFFSAIASGLPLMLCAAIFAAALGVGAAILAGARSRIAAARSQSPMTVVLVQPNCDPRKNPYTDSLDRLYSLSDEAVRTLGRKPDLVVWPEGAFMLDIRYWTEPGRRDSYWGGIVQGFLDYQESLGTWLLTGTQDHGLAREDGELVPKDFNSSILLNPDGTRSDIYHKIHLVPFGEHFPLNKKKFAPLYDLFKTYEISDWGVGDRYAVFNHPKGDFSTPICFEDVFPDGVRRYVLAGAQVIVNMSNDYWSLNPVEGRQHGIFALFRAVENQRPFLRATESGYTVSIDATGRIEPGSPEQYTEGFVVAHVSRARFPLTVYTKAGDWFPALTGILIGLAVLFMLCRWAHGLSRRVLNVSCISSPEGGDGG